MKFKIDHDLHLHSYLSSCSSNPEQTPMRMLEYAKELGLKKICVTDHFWDERVGGASEWYAPQNFPHIKKNLPLPTIDGIDLLFGCESDMDKRLRIGISPERYDAFDFIIIPTSHLHMTEFTIDESVSSPKARADYYMERCHTLLSSDMPFHKVGLAHFTSGLLARKSEGTRDDIMNAISGGDLYDLFKKAAGVGIGIEINTALSDATNEAALRPYRIAKECGCKFYLGSDAHSPRDLDGARARFAAMINALDLSENDKFDFARA